MTDPIFVTVSVITIGAAIVALEFKELIYGAIALAISLLGIAMFFVMLDATFIAMFQVAVYIGAVVVLIIFTIMLVRKETWLEHAKEGPRKVLAIILGLGVMLFIGALYLSTNLSSVEIKDKITLTLLSKQMLTYYSPALIVLGLTLAASVIGALVLARIDPKKGEE